MGKVFWGLAAGLVVVAGLMVWTRNIGVPEDRYRLSGPIPALGDHPEEGGFTAVRKVADAAAPLRRLIAEIEATPRTGKLAGSAEAGEASFVTRSLVWGFPDVTNVRAGADRVEIRGHLVIGKGDLGVNRRRIEGWLDRAGLDAPA